MFYFYSLPPSPIKMMRYRKLSNRDVKSQANLAGRLTLKTMFNFSAWACVAFAERCKVDETVGGLY